MGGWGWCSRRKEITPLRSKLAKPAGASRFLPATKALLLQPKPYLFDLLLPLRLPSVCLAAAISSPPLPSCHFFIFSEKINEGLGLHVLFSRFSRSLPQLAGLHFFMSL